MAKKTPAAPAIVPARGSRGLRPVHQESGLQYRRADRAGKRRRQGRSAT
ncbi:MAG: hypothetical protein MZU95_01135 [Desulfomicrobium escambiense]|nr:hypothetical protein [Desulfomicrobium escambiense]